MKPGGVVAGLLQAAARGVPRKLDWDDVTISVTLTEGLARFDVVSRKDGKRHAATAYLDAFEFDYLANDARADGVAMRLTDAIEAVGKQR